MIPVLMLSGARQGGDGEGAAVEEICSLIIISKEQGPVLLF